MSKKITPDGKERLEIEKSFKEVTEWFADEIPTDKESHAIKSCIEYMKMMEQVVSFLQFHPVDSELVFLLQQAYTN